VKGEEGKRPTGGECGSFSLWEQLNEWGAFTEAFSTLLMERKDEEEKRSQGRKFSGATALEGSSFVKRRTFSVKTHPGNFLVASQNTPPPQKKKKKHTINPHQHSTKRIGSFFKKATVRGEGKGAGKNHRESKVGVRHSFLPLMREEYNIEGEEGKGKT